MTQAAGAGYYSHLFEGFSPVGSNASNFDGEILAIHHAAERLLAVSSNPTRVVFFVDSQAAIVALTNNTPTDCAATMAGRRLMSGMIESGWHITLQWIPSHIGIEGNERADQLAKQGARLPQPSNTTSLMTAKNLVERVVSKWTKNFLREACTGKQWESLAHDKQIPRNLPRAEAVAKFRLLTGHDYLQAHLHRIGLANSDICLLCTISKMEMCIRDSI